MICVNPINRYWHLHIIYRRRAFSVGCKVSCTEEKEKSIDNKSKEESEPKEETNPNIEKKDTFKEAKKKIILK